MRAEATERPDLFSKPCKKYALATLENEGQNTNGRSATILQPQLTLTTAASAPNPPLATRRTGVARGRPVWQTRENALPTRSWCTPRPKIRRLAEFGAKILKRMPGHPFRLRTRDFLKISKTPKRRRRQRCRQHSEDDRRLSTCNRALSAYLEKLPSGPRHQASRISHLTSN